MSIIIELPRHGFAKALNFIRLCWDTGATPILLGRPGEAKSACSLQAAIAYGVPAERVAIINAANVDPTGVSGYDFPAAPEVNNGKAISNKPSWWIDGDAPWAIVIEDLPDCSRAVESALYTLLHAEERRVGNWKLPDNVRVVCTGNRASDGTISRPLGTAAVGRLSYCAFEQTSEEWIESYGIHHTTPEVCAFLSWEPSLFNTFDPTKKGVPYASARTWSAAGRKQAACDDIDTLRLALPGDIGASAAGQFCGFLNLKDQLPDLDEIEDDPDRVAVPSDPSAKHLVSCVLARIASVDNFDNVLAYIVRCGREFTQSFIYQARAANPEITTTRAYQLWTAENDIRLKI